MGIHWDKCVVCCYNTDFPDTAVERPLDPLDYLEREEAAKARAAVDRSVAVRYCVDCGVAYLEHVAVSN